MIYSKIALSTVLLLLMALTCTGQIFDRELRNQKERTQKEFLKFITELGGKITDSTLTKEQQNALFKPIVAYAHKEHADLTRLRKKYLKKIQAPPSVLNAFIFDSEPPAELSKMLGTPQFTTVTLLQCYRPIEIGRLISGIIQPVIYQQSNTGTNEATIAYTFGNQAFAKQLKEDIWQIWLVNRLYMLRFNLDLQTMVIDHSEYTLPNKAEYLRLQFPFVIQKPTNELEKLYQEMDEIRWNSYSSTDIQQVSPQEWQDTIDKRLSAFYLKNQPRFIKVQNEILKDIEKGNGLDASWQELHLSSDENIQLTQTLKNNMLQPDEAAQRLFSFSNSIIPFNQDIEEIGKNAMSGFLHYIVGHEKDQVWKIRSLGYSIAFEYTWDLKQGRFSEIKIFKKQS
ncbi:MULTISPECIES: hypothetical protein [Sphingobacterium]|uniref:Uncharacterized protein n=1 Tax=Sphingobacterium siyangense TaxID=459529 RepID=A0A562MBX3_9SPHI|nr:hypothetical protein [Sphingobacterium siyangense]TWI17332.1 hypothetical protein IQ31_03774 [Sphingobacterium siyangense]